MVSLDDAVAASECLDRPATGLRPDAKPANAKGGRPDASLARLIEAEIIPRLMLAHQDPPVAPSALRPDFSVGDTDVDGFAGLMIRLDLSTATGLIDAAIARGAALEAIFLDLFARTARRLGEMWLDDRCSFADVTIGLCGLQKLLRGYGPLHEAMGSRAEVQGLALFAPVPGEQHTFGIMMLESFFRQAGWDVVGLPQASVNEMVATVSRRHFDMVGLSVSCESQLGLLTSLIKTVRSKSRNKAIVVMAGGRVFNDDPALVHAVGADITASDGRQAVVATQHVLWSTSRTH